ncbi:MAG: hypothetical protein OXF02_07145 [Simkaniaceae bacterium]|nr:hypothetical protein [Simkaniaceae bacterium]
MGRSGRGVLLVKRVGFRGCVALFSVGIAVFSYGIRERIRGRRIETIIQTGPEKEALRSDYLAELIGCYSGASSPRFTLKNVRESLMRSHVMETVRLAWAGKEALTIDYSVRKPYLYLAEYRNAVCDRKGYPFPLFPFRKRERLPSVYAGLTSLRWGRPPQSYSRIRQFLEYLEKETDFFSMAVVDMTRADHPSPGRREITVEIPYERGTVFLRLTPVGYREELVRYRRLSLPEGDMVVDLRLKDTALIKAIDSVKHRTL